jgi:hypothetical protein
LDLFEYSWLTSFQITKKNHKEISVLLRDDVIFPTLGKDPSGYIICLAKPRRKDNGLTHYLNLRFDLNDDLHKRLLWQTFKASVFHLSMHAAISNFEDYAEWSKNKNLELATFTASIIEDARVTAGLKQLWPPFKIDVATANTLSYLKMKPVHLISNSAMRLMSSVISYMAMGAVKGRAADKLKSDTETIVAALNDLEENTQKHLAEMTETNKEDLLSNSKDNSLREERISTANLIYTVLRRYGGTSEVPSLLYVENHGSDSIFHGSDIPSENDVGMNLENASRILSEQVCEANDPSRQTEMSVDTEISQIFSAWESKETAEKKILESYRELGSDSRFSCFEFPRENFSEYLKTKAILSSPIRRVLDKLRLYKNQTGEDYRHEVGLLDMQEAIQVIASKSQRTDVFVRDELQSREDAWAVLVDASHSLKFFTGEIRGIALCLSEVARELFPNQNAWAQFAFSDKFYVLKDFSEIYSNRVRARVGGLEHGGMSYIPDAMFLTAEALKRRTEELKLLVVVSDFFPSGYINAEDKLAQCVKKIEKSGMGVIGIGVKSRAVKNYFRIACVVDNPYDLMKKFVQAFFEFSSTA